MKLIHILASVHVTDTENAWDICDELRMEAENTSLSGCPLGFCQVGSEGCRACPLNEKTDWLEDL